MDLLSMNLEEINDFFESLNSSNNSSKYDIEFIIERAQNI